VQRSKMAENEEVVVEQGRDYESEAKAQGWKPQEEFNGDPGKWVDAETFVNRGEQYVGILKDKYDRLEQRLREQEQLTSDVKTLYNRQAEADKAKIAELVTQLEARREQAVTEGDGAAFSQLDRQLSQARDAQKALEKPAHQQPQAQLKPWAQEWMSQNEWYGRDESATAVAETYAKRLRADHPGLSEREFLNKVSEHVRTEIPRLAGTQVRRNPAVEGNGRPPQGGDPKSTGSLYNKLPDDAKAEFIRFVKRGVFKSTDADRAEYARLYNA
jgi:hypothetical protein